MCTFSLRNPPLYMSDDPDTRSRSRYSWRRWVVVLGFGIFFSVLLWRVINPYRGQPYEKIPHGDHTHYVPKDRNTEVPVSRFPTQPPAEGERITPDGDVVPAQ